jgi:hypothetical protein
MGRFVLACGVLVGLVGCAELVGCAAGQSGAGGAGGSGGAATSTGTQGSTSTGTGTGTATTGTGFMTGSTGTGMMMGPAEVFGHSADTLYKLNPNTKAVIVVAPFSGGCTSVQDIALDKDSHLYATTKTALYSVDKDTAVCTLIAGNGTYPNSLSFVPAGTLDPAVEALVGYVTDAQGKNNQYVRIDPQSGAVSNIGGPWNGGSTSPNPSELVSSGDIVSVIGGPTYLTVKAAPGNSTRCSMADCLVEVNPQTGRIAKDYGELASYKQVFGTAFWAGSVYGFTNKGQLFEVKIQGSIALTTDIPVASGLSFWGAGSTTAAPPVPN